MVLDNSRVNLNNYVSFTAPAGWQQVRQSALKDVDFSSEDGAQELSVSVLDGAKDFDGVAERKISSLAMSNTAVVLNDEKIQTQSGFEGRRCDVIEPIEAKAGECAMVKKDAEFVTVIAYGSEGRRVVDDVLAELKVEATS